MKYLHILEDGRFKQTHSEPTNDDLFEVDQCNRQIVKYDPYKGFCFAIVAADEDHNCTIASWETVKNV